MDLQSILEDEHAGPTSLGDLPVIADELVEPVATTGSWQRWKRPYQVAAITGDAIVALVCALVVMMVHNGAIGGAGIVGRSGIVLGLTVVWPALFFFSRCYDARYVGAGTQEFVRICNAAVRVLAVVALVSFAFKLSLARSFVGITLPCAVAGSLLWHWSLRSYLNHARARGRGLHRVLVVGRRQAATRVIQALSTTSGEGVGLSVVGVCTESGRDVSIGDRNVAGAGHLTDIVAAINRCRADTVVVASDSGLSPTELRRLGWQLEGSSVDLLVGTDLVEVAGPRIHVRPVAGLPLLHVEQPEFRGARRLVKASYDRVLATLALVFLSPLLLAVAVIVRLDSPGKALYRQTRIGRHGKTFTIVKFRSMHADADARLADLMELNEHDGPLFKIKADPRITRVGGILRRLSLDELPQLWNVVRGDMSLVGPRPPLPAEVERYADDVRRRLLVKPGVTGLWQVSGRSSLTWEQCVRLDLSYVENWSPALDLMIMLKTLKAVTARSGAY